MKLQRKDSWPDELAAHLEARRDIPFAWGSNDCCLFAADCVLAMTGVDLAENLRGYDSALGAARILNAYGNDVTKLVDALGLERVNVAYAKRGDMVACSFVAGEARFALGICNGLTSAFVSESGIRYIPTLECVAAWRI